MNTFTLVPRLVVRDADQALAFYVAAFDARSHERFADPAGHVVHAALQVGECRWTLTEEARDWGNDAPPSLGGTAVLLSITVDDADAVAARMVAAGATVVIPVEDRFYGAREGRIRDPFGHLWIVSQPLSPMTDEEIQRGVDGWVPSPSRRAGA